jgi:[ribosomal protein S5]-alanine N-acetyltransferase
MIALLQTDRCRLFNLQQTDFDNVSKLYANEAVRKYLGGTIQKELLKEKFIEEIHPKVNKWNWVIKTKDHSQFIGLVSLDPHLDGEHMEVSYQLLPNWWGKGYGTEIVHKIIHYAFNELNLPKILAETQTANISSCKLLEKVGMYLENTVQRFGAEQAIYAIKKGCYLKDCC